MIKAVFFDIDMTLFDHENGCWNASSLKAIKALKKRGVKVFICSARPYHSLVHFGCFHLGFRWDGYVSCSGAVAAVGRHYVYQELIDPNIVFALERETKKRGLALEIVTLKKRFLTREGGIYYENYRKIYQDIDYEIHPYHGEKSTGTLLYAPIEYDEELRKNFPDLAWFRFCDYGVDITEEFHKKSKGAKAIMDHFGFKKEEALAFGDDIQDIPMKECSTFICMGGGNPKAIAEADFVADRIENDGLVKALKHFGVWEDQQ